jgi:hypothetical protein
MAERQDGWNGRTEALLPSLAAILLFCLSALPAAAEPAPKLDTVLARASAYVADFHRRLSSIVAEERYVQEWKRVRDSASGDSQIIHRELLSDLLLVKPNGAQAWMEFRDVFEVDGRAVRERDERLVKMFLEPSPSTRDQIGKILRESARYNIGDVLRNVNTPVFPLLFLEEANRFRFKFKRTSDGKPATAPPDSAGDGAFRVSTEIWVIAYEEKESHTMIRTDEEKDLPSKGRFWIDPDSGQVLMSELTAENRSMRAIIDVSYQSEPIVGMLVPVEMRERYEAKRRNYSVVEGHATYGRFRQFQVKVDEKLAPIVK